MLGMTGQIQIDEQGTRRPDYVFLIIQDGRLMPLWTANSSSGITWINPEPVKWPMSSFPPDANPECAWDDKCASKQLFGENIIINVQLLFCFCLFSVYTV